MAKNTQNTARKTVDPKHAALVGHTCEVTGGRNIEHGTKLAVIRVFVNKFGGETALAKVKVTDKAGLYVNPKYLKKGKPLPAADLAVLKAEDDENNRPILGAFNVLQIGREKDATGKPVDGGSVTSLRLGYHKWPRGIWFPVEMVEKVQDITSGDNAGMVLYTVPAFKIRSEYGQDMLDSMSEDQDHVRKTYKLDKSYGS